MCRWDVRRVVADVQKGRDAFIFKIKHGLVELEDESIIILRNVENYLPSDTESHPRRLDIQHRRYNNVKSRKIVSFFRTRNFSRAHFCLVTSFCVMC
jgi:hypothetical protein